MKIPERSEWVSKKSRRKGWIKYATATHVKICFTSSSVENFKVHTRKDFLGFYMRKPVA
jgi:hypothetical protein